MRILYLGNENQRIINFLKKDGHSVIVTSEKITKSLLKNIDYIISFGYRHIIPKDVVELFYKKAINLHISYLPWNRGADPNLWSFLENTPKGVSIHYINENLDKGDILLQKYITYDCEDTLKSTYSRLIKTVEEVFIQHWQEIKNNNIIALKQETKGSYHNLKDKEKYLYLLNYGWDTNVNLLIGKGKS